MEKNKMRRIRRSAVIFLIVLFAAVAVVWAVFTALKKQESVGISDGAYYYVIGEKTEIPHGSALRREEESTKVENKGSSYSLSGSMIYEDEGKTYLFQDDMLWYDKETQSMKRITYFSRMTKEGSDYVIERGNSEKQISGGFLYDNRDLYVILEEAVLTYAQESYTISPGSVLSCTYNGDIQLTAEDGSCVYLEQPGQELKVTFADGCVLNPLVDTYYQINGAWRILFTTASMVPEL